MTTADAEKAAKKQKRDILITSVLLVVFAFTFTQNVLIRKKPAPAPEIVSGENAQTMAEDLLFVTNLRVKDKVYADQLQAWDKEWPRDPFVPQASLATIVKAVNLTLNGILWDDAEPKAIVNEKTLVEGDTIYGYTVERIRKKSVILRTGEKNIELYVFHPMAAAESSAPAA